MKKMRIALLKKSVEKRITFLKSVTHVLELNLSGFIYTEIKNITELSPYILDQIYEAYVDSKLTLDEFVEKVKEELDYVNDIKILLDEYKESI